jgi:hypothetical protein
VGLAHEAAQLPFSAISALKLNSGHCLLASIVGKRYWIFIEPGQIETSENDIAIVSLSWLHVINSVALH